MKIQDLYETLEHEVKERKDKLMAKSWRGDLSIGGLKSIRWGDLNNIVPKIKEKEIK